MDRRTFSLQFLCRISISILTLFRLLIRILSVLLLLTITLLFVRSVFVPAWSNKTCLLPLRSWLLLLLGFCSFLTAFRFTWVLRFTSSSHQSITCLVLFVIDFRTFVSCSCLIRLSSCCVLSSSDAASASFRFLLQPTISLIPLQDEVPSATCLQPHSSFRMSSHLQPVSGLILFPEEVPSTAYPQPHSSFRVRPHLQPLRPHSSFG